VIIEQLALINPGGKKRVTLKVQHLPVIVGGNAHIAHQHVRKTHQGPFPYTISFRHEFPCIFSAPGKPFQPLLAACRKTSVFRHPQIAIAISQKTATN
jgi:hypothetical protein